jgi:hypothetical protein
MLRHVGLLSLAAIAAMLLGFAAANAEETGEMPAELAEMMALMAKYAEPSEHHQHLRLMEGEWSGTAKIWMGPGEPMTTTGSQVVEPIMGGHYLMTRFTGNFMGEQFDGIGIDGYDNYAGKHVAIWIDTASTMMMTFAGTCEDGGKVIKMEAKYQDPRIGGENWMRGITTIIDDNHFKYEGWEPGPDGEPMKTMEILYERQS